MKHLLIIILLIIGFSCKKTNHRFSKTDIQIISTDYDLLYAKKDENPQPPPSIYIFLNFFIKSKSGKINIVNPTQLFYLYLDSYTKSFKNFELFLNKVLNSNFILEITPNHQWEKELNFNKKFYEKNNKSIKELIKYYFINNRHKEVYTSNFETINRLTEPELSTLYYIISKAGYYINFNDYSGGITIMKTLQ